MWSPAGGKPSIFSPTGVGPRSRGPKVTYHSFQYQAAVTRNLFTMVLDRVARLAVPSYPNVRIYVDLVELPVSQAVVDECAHALL